MVTGVQTGSIRIFERAIAKIASHAIQEIHEVAALVEGRTKRVDRRKYYKAIRISVEELNLAIDIQAIVQLGTPLYDLSKEIQFKIKQVVEDMTGLVVSAVNIRIVGVYSKGLGI